MLNCADMKQRFFHAIKNGEFCVWYQPQVDMRSGTPRGAEALVRWKRADGGFVEPAGFVAELERLGLMERLDEEVLQIVCRDIREGKKRGFSPGTVSVNLSRLHAEKAGTADRLKEMVERHGVSRREVSFEITETAEVEEITVPEEAVSSATDSGVAGGLDLPQDDTYGDGSVVKPAEPAEQNSNLGDSWESYTVQVNDTVLTLPCTVSDLEAAGVKLDTQYTPSDYIVNAGEYELAWFKADSGATIMVDMINKGSEPKEIKDCLVGSVCADAYSMTQGGLTVIFPGGIQVGSPEADLLAAYGEADDVYKDENYGNSYYWYGDDVIASGFNASIDPETGLIVSLNIENEG